MDAYTIRPDPWKRRHAWRHTGINSWHNRRRNLLPGFGISVLLFSAYIAWDQLTHPENVESLQRAYHEKLARQDHIRDLMSEYNLIGKKKHVEGEER